MAHLCEAPTASNSGGADAATQRKHNASATLKLWCSTAKNGCKANRHWAHTVANRYRVSCCWQLNEASDAKMQTDTTTTLCDRFLLFLDGGERKEILNGKKNCAFARGARESPCLTGTAVVRNQQLQEVRMRPATDAWRCHFFTLFPVNKSGSKTFSQFFIVFLFSFFW